MVGQAVKGVVLDDSVLFLNSNGDNPNHSLRPATDALLRHLWYSMFRTVPVSFLCTFFFFFTISTHYLELCLVIL